MPAVNFSPVFNGWQGFTPSGLPLNGGLLYTYQAGSSTLLATYTTSAGNIANSNPIQLGTDGRPPSEIWLDAAYSYKFILADSLDNPIGTYDNITGIDNSVPAALSEWVVSGLTPSYVSATQFTLAGDQTSLFQVGRRVRYTLGSGQSTGSITASVYAAITTVTVVTDSIPLDNTLSAVDYGFLTALKPSVPYLCKNVFNASFGATFGNQAIADTDTLDWYKEGNWTPVLLGGVPTTSTLAGRYTRFGNRIAFDLDVVVTNWNAAAGAITITGLPYASASGQATALTCVYSQGSTSIALPTAYIAGASSTIVFKKQDGSTFDVATVSSLPWWLTISGTYQA